MRKLVGCIALTALMSAAPVSVALAADRDFCRDYTTAALRQVYIAQSHPSCSGVVDFNNPRWSSDRHVHWDWCRGQSRDAAWAERDARTHILRRCT